MCFFQNAATADYDKNAIAANAINPDFDMAVLEILISFNQD
jgi:hypothetical protein